VIVQLPPDVDVGPMLGAHKWPPFISNYNGHKDGASVIFEYNWRMGGTQILVGYIFLVLIAGIFQLPPDVDVEPMLGVHKWPLFISSS